MRIILEGPDCSGKTTLAKHLLNHFAKHSQIHNSLDENKNFVWRDLDRNILKKHKYLRASHIESLEKKNIIIDRFWPSEFVYGNLFRKKIEYNITDLKHEAETYDPIYIGCLPPKDLVAKRFAMRAAENEEDFSTVENVYDMYEFLFDTCKEFTIFDYTIESLDQFVRRFALEH